MTTELLDRARAALWRQDGRALQTNEETRNWLEQHPLCLLQSRQDDTAPPAPTFVGAALGEASRAPTPETVGHAYSLLQPLLEAGSVVMLQLGVSGEEAYFLVEVELLPWVIALAGDRDWKQPPQASGPRQTSQLALDVWKLLKQDSPLTASAARDALGGDLTKAAVLHALEDLWRMLRVAPLGAPEEARWELMEQHHRQALVAGSAASQVTALSLIVSSYLQSVYAAAEEEIEEFLSPLAARSRIREAVRGLAATRQIVAQTFGTRSLYLLEGTSELLEATAPAEPGAEEAISAAPEPGRVAETQSTAAPWPAPAATVAVSAAARAGKPGRDRKELRRKEPTPVRREQKSGWRTFSSAPEMQQDRQQGQRGSHDRGKGWERPKRRFSGPPKPWLHRKEEDRGSEHQDRRSDRRDEGGSSSQRFRDKPFRGRRDQGGGYGARSGGPGRWTRGRFDDSSAGRGRRGNEPAAGSRGGASEDGAKRPWSGGARKPWSGGAKKAWGGGAEKARSGGAKKRWDEGAKKPWGQGPKKPWGKSSRPFSDRPPRRFSDRPAGPGFSSSRSAESGGRPNSRTRGFGGDTRTSESRGPGGWQKKPGKSFGPKSGKRFGAKPGKRFGKRPEKNFGSKPGFSRFGGASKGFRGKKGGKRKPLSEEPGRE